VPADLLKDPAGRTLREALAARPDAEPAPSERPLLRRLAALVDSGRQNPSRPRGRLGPVPIPGGV